MRRFLLFAPALVFMAIRPAFAAQPLWAKKATAFPVQCEPGKTEACKPLRIPAPNGKSSVEVRYRKDVSEWGWVLRAYLRVATPDGATREATLPEAYGNVELLWAPDFHTFLLNGDGDGAPVSGLWVYVYPADYPADPRDVTENAQRDMVKEFPDCKAAYPNADDAGGCKKVSRPIDVETCVKTKANPKYSPEYNMTGIDWVTPSSILVMARIPCDSLYGGIMCQVMGYELQVPTGRILNRTDAKELKLRWQKSIAWDFRIPDPPRYCE